MRPVDDNVRCAFEAAAGCPAARAWYALPTPARHMSNAEWQEVAATAFAVTSPALKPFVGHSILGSRRVVDPYGSVFFNDTGLAARGGARTRWHDTLNRAIFAALREGEVQVVREVEGLFRDLIPQSNRAAYLRANPSSRRRQGIVPDLRYCRNLVHNLADVKTMAHGPSRYGPPGRSCGRRPPGPSGQ